MQKAKEETEVVENSFSTCAMESTRNLNQHQSKIQSSFGSTTTIFSQTHLVASWIEKKMD